MTKQNRDTLLLIIGFAAAWFAFVGLVLAGLPISTQQIIGVLSLGLLPLVFGAGFWAGNREAKAERDGLAKGLKLKQSGTATRYNPRKKQEAAVDLSQVLNGAPVTKVIERGGDSGVREL